MFFTVRRLLSFLISICLILTQTAQAYSLARLPHKHQHPDITSQSRLDATNQSFNRSSLIAGNGLTIISGNNIIASGTDMAANKGDLALNAGGTVALLAGQDTLSQQSSTQILTNPNFFTKQRRSITDTYNSIDSQGSTLAGNSVSINSGADIILQAAQVAAGTGGINLDAGNTLQLLAAVNSSGSSHQETLTTDGMTVRANGTSDKTSDRRLNNRAENQTQTSDLTQLASAGDITTHSGGDTRIEASQLNAQGAIDLSAGGSMTFAAVKDSTYSNVTDSHSSMLWQGSTGHGDYTETLKLANINAGKGLTVDASGGIVVDIPTVKNPAPAQPVLAQPLSPEQQAEQHQADLAQQIKTLASQPGQAWIGQLAQQAHDHPDQVRLNEVNAAMQHWDYAHEGLTGEAAAVIAIIVTCVTYGSASEAAAGIAGEGTATAAALTVGMTTLASQATVSLINNKGDVGKTLDDMGKSENIKALVLAMVTAGVLKGLNTNLGIDKVNAKSLFTDQLQKNLIDNAASAVLDHAINGGDLTRQLEQSLKNAFIDTGSAQSANKIGDLYDDKTLDAFTHQLAHAIAGCAAGAAKANDCSSGALGAVVGELSAELYGGNRTNPDQPGVQTDTVNFARMMAGIAVAITGGDAAAINLGAAAGGNAAENNALLHPKEIQWINNNAQQYANDKGISLEQAKAILAQQAARNEDATAATLLGATPNDDAQKFLSGAQGTYTNEKGEQQALFTSKPGDYMNGLMNATDVVSDPNSKAFYQQYIQPTTSNSSITSGLIGLGQVKGEALPGAVYGLAVGAVTHPIDTGVLMVTGMWSSLTGAGNSLGAGAVLLTDTNTQNILDSLYGRSDAHVLAGVFSTLPADVAVGGAVFGGTAARGVGNTVGTVADTTLNTIVDAALSDQKFKAGTILGYKSADEINAAMLEANKSLPPNQAWSSAWMPGTQVAETIIAPGTRVQMVVDAAEYQKLVDGKGNFGGWATFDNVPNQAYARNQLAITSDMKPNTGYVVEVEITQPINAQVGVAGPQGTAAGGGNQLHFIFPQQDRASAFKVVGGRALP